MGSWNPAAGHAWEQLGITSDQYAQIYNPGWSYDQFAEAAQQFKQPAPQQQQQQQAAPSQPQAQPQAQAKPAATPVPYMDPVKHVYDGPAKAATPKPAATAAPAAAAPAQQAMQGLQAAMAPPMDITGPAVGWADDPALAQTAQGLGTAIPKQAMNALTQQVRGVY